MAAYEIESHSLALHFARKGKSTPRPRLDVVVLVEHLAAVEAEEEQELRHLGDSQ